MRYLKQALALTAGTILAASSALGAAVDGLTVVEPITAANTETIGPRSTIIVDVAGGLAAANVITDGQPVSRAALIGLDGAGAVIPGVFLEVSAGVVAQNYNDAGNPGVNDLLINLANVVGVESFLQTAGVASFRLIVTTGDIVLNVNNINGVQTVFNANEAADQNFGFDVTRPNLTAVILNTAGTQIFFVFSESLNSGNATNDPNHTVLANVVAAADFELSTDGGATFAGTPTLLTDPPTFAAGNTILVFARAGASNTTVGTFIRPDHNAGAVDHILNDEVKNQATTNAVAITTQVALGAVSASFVKEVPIGGGAQAGAVRVTFNNPITNVGSADVYVLRRPNAAGSSTENSTIALSNPTLDPNDPFSVLLDATPGGVEGIGANGRSTSNNTNAVPDNALFEVRVTDAGTTDPVDVFTGTFAGTTDLDAGEEIEPTLELTAFGDINGDGHQDTAYLVFDEPMGNVTVNTGFTLVRQAATVNPFQLVGADGALVEAMTAVNATPANNNLPNITVTRSSIDLDGDGTIDDRETNNAVCIAYDPLTFDWDNDGNAGLANDPNEAIPGTGDANVIQVQYQVGTGTVQDANTNTFSNADVNVASLTSGDRARPRVAVILFFTGDNQPANNSNNQAFAETDGTLGDSRFNDRIAIYFGEDLAGLNGGAVNEEQVFFGPGLSSSFPAGDGFLFAADNCLTLVNDNGDTDLAVGATVSIAASSGIVDPDNNEALSGDTIDDCRAPFNALQSGVDGGTFNGAFLADADADGFADSIRLSMTQAILGSTLANSDFTLSIGTITGVAVDTASNSTIVISITDGVVSMSNAVTVTYNGATDTNRIASDSAAGGSGKAISAINTSITARRVQESNFPTQDVAIMDVIGTATLDGTTPLPAGTKVYAMVAFPSVRKITATHNNATFAVDANWDTSSLEAWNNWLYGLEEFVYLGRDEDNFQFYSNFKDIADDDNERTLEDVIQLAITARGLTSITFTGRGETTADIVANGRVDLCWDVLRSSGGLLQNLYRRFFGWSYGGTPITSRAVVTGNDGRFELHVSAPISAFNARANLNGVGFPVILIVETTDGRRFAVSSLATSINGGPLLFNPNNRRQNADRTAPNATVFNINLANVGAVSMFPGWNLVGFNRASGFSTTTARPTLPAGVATSQVVSGSALPFVGPLDQFVYWLDNTVDGVWTVSEDSDFSNIVVDFDCLNSFAFTMTNLGVQVGAGITNIVGGYGIGIFLNEGGNSYGMFQFGAPRTGNVLFPTTAPFVNSTTNLGWALLTSPATFNPATAIRGTNNPTLDFIILFRNNGPTSTQVFEVSSLDLIAPTGTDNPNDTVEVDAAQAFFGHFQ